MKRRLRIAMALLLSTQLAGCSTLTESGFGTDAALRLVEKRTNHKPESADGHGKVANPPAKTLRFDGHEIVLGESEDASLDVERLIAMLQPLIQQQRMQTAASVILQHRETSERLLAERWASEPDSVVVQLAADVLSRRNTGSAVNYRSLLELARKQRGIAVQYQDLRNDFANQMRNSEPDGEVSEKLLQASLKISHPLVKIDALRLLGLRELVAGRNAWAESQFRQAIEQATSSGNKLIAADLWLTVAEAARRGGQLEAANSAWNNAIHLHLAAGQDAAEIDSSFWLMADKTKSETSTWPNEVGPVLAQKLQAIGCTNHGSSEMSLWAAIAQSQYQRGEMQMALVNFKRAETLASGQNVLWLRIAQAKCLAGMSQAAAASAILSGPAASHEPEIAAAAMATMGSIKLQSGAYQQGAQLLMKALDHSKTVSWPGRNQAIADLAIAKLIFGDTETGLNSLHEAQQLLEQAGERTLLVQSLDNELRLLEHEHRANHAATIKVKIQQLEKY